MPSIIIRCHRCRLDQELPDGVDVASCPACDALNSRPQSSGSELVQLQRATQERLAGEYANAEQSYLSVLRIHPTEHEALWGRVLCHYGVEYVQDPRSQSLYPTVHYTRTLPMQLHPDFKAALQYAPPLIAQQYRQDAAYVDDAQARIRERGESTEPFDIFLCHKTTQGEGAPYTAEYQHALAVYYELEKAGYRVFFAPESGLTPGANYEAGIYHALASSRVMLLICADEENLNSSWVRSEWSRYIEMMEKDSSDRKRLMPLFYPGFTASQLPDEIRLRRLEGLSMGELNSKERLLAALRNHLGSRTEEASTPVPARAALTEEVQAPSDSGFMKTVNWISHHINTWRIIFFPLCAYAFFELLMLLPIPAVTDTLKLVNPDNFIGCRAIYLLVASTIAGLVLWLVPKLIHNTAARFVLNTLGVISGCILTCLLVSHLCWTGNYPLWDTPLGIALFVFPMLISIAAIIVTFIVRLFFVFILEIK